MVKKINILTGVKPTHGVMKHSLLAVLLFIAVTATAAAQTSSNQHSPALEEGLPSTVGMSEERLSLIDAMIEQSITNQEIPGAVALVARNGKIVYHKAFGTSNPETGDPYQTDHIFRIASQTKAITSTAVMMLWEKGLFRLDDPIARYIPEFGEATILDTFNEEDSSYTSVKAEDQITIRQLLNHTSGIGYGIIDGDERIRKIYQKAGIVDLYTTEAVTIEDNIKTLAQLPLHHNPGEKFTYSEGLDVLGYFVEVISGKPFDVFLRDHLFEPLGMDDTYFYVPEDKHHRVVPVQTRIEDEWGFYEHPEKYYDENYPISGAQTFFSGGAGLTSTAKDYATFLQMYLNGGELNGTRILSRTTVDVIMANQTGDLFGQGNAHYGLAFGVLNAQGAATGGRGSSGTFDWGGYFNTQYFADPQEQVIGVLLKQTQLVWTDQSGWKFRQLVGAAVDD